MPQEFLASFAVQIDEGGVSRLQKLLQDNRDLADKLADAFDNARKSMEDFIREATEGVGGMSFTVPSNPLQNNLLTGVPVSLDFSEASKQVAAFAEELKKKLRLTADASGIVSAASGALSRVRSLFSSPIRISASVDYGEDNRQGVRFLSSGGRFSSPTRAEIAEDGNPEYVIPVSREREAVPLLRSLLSELSASARESLRDFFGGSAGASPVASGSGALASSAGTASLSGLFSSLPDLTAAAPAAAPVIVQAAAPNNVSAPVNIHVEAASADPEAVGKSIYDTAERYWLRTVGGFA